MTSAEVIIIGGGLNGASAALFATMPSVVMSARLLARTFAIRSGFVEKHHAFFIAARLNDLLHAE